MFKLLLAMAFLAGFSMSAAQATDGIGFREINLPDPAGSRSLHVSIWYPTSDDGPVVSIGEHRVFYGIAAIRNAQPPSEAHPLVVLSHGYGGTWRNLNWLAGELVGQGYVVAAPDHAGTTTFNKDPAEAAKLWERPRDLSRVIDALSGDIALAGRIDPGRIAAIGHSLGGWTVAALAGARFDADQFAADCDAHPNPRTCGLAQELGLAASIKAGTPLDEDMKDARIGAVVSLDLGLARGFTSESLNAIRTPFLVFGAGIDIGDLPAKMESGYLAEHLPADTARYVEIPDATHFTFMQLFKPGAAALIEAETPGDGIVAKDGGTRDRASIHREIADMIIAFMAKSIPPK